MPVNLVLSSLKHVWETLTPLHLPMAVMGGLALAVWQHVRATRDVDLLLSLGETDPSALTNLLTAAGLSPKHRPPIAALGSVRIAQFLYQPSGAFVDIQVDVLLADSEYHRQALDRRVPARLPDLDVEVHVLACEDLILHKLVAGRIIDRADAAALLRLNREFLDLDYLRNWVRDLGVAGEFQEAWREAFPGEAP